MTGRGEDVVMTTVVLHSTETKTAEEALGILRSLNLSYHYLIDRNGTVLELVEPPAMAFHAGESLGPDGPACNRYSVGVSFVNLNDGIDPVTEAQERAAAELIKALKGTCPGLRWLTTHAIIAPSRKVDPKGYNAESLAALVSLELWTGS